MLSAPEVVPEKRDSNRCWGDHLQIFLLKFSVYKGVRLTSLNQQYISPDKDWCRFDCS